MTVEKARELLGDEYRNMSDEEIENLMGMLKSICSIVVEDYVQKRNEK